MGVLLEQLFQQVLDGRLENQKDALLAEAAEWITQNS